ncbi:hypothetical protein D3C73_888920 [compost metagenome]
MSTELGNPFQISIFHRNRILWMPSYGSVNEIISLGQLHGGGNRLPVKSDINHPGNPMLYRAGNYLFPILVKLRGIQMGMCIK